jgi:hypothetical protein
MQLRQTVLCLRVLRAGAGKLSVDSGLVRKLVSLRRIMVCELVGLLRLVARSLQVCGRVLLCSALLCRGNEGVCPRQISSGLRRRTTRTPGQNSQCQG